jgi:hypothetical protein
MQRDEKSETSIRLEERLTERYGILLSQTELAELLDRTPGGLRYKPLPSTRLPDPQTARLRPANRPAGVLPGCGSGADHCGSDIE